MRYKEIWVGGIVGGILVYPISILIGLIMWWNPLLPILEGLYQITNCKTITTTGVDMTMCIIYGLPIVILIGVIIGALIGLLIHRIRKSK